MGQSSSNNWTKEFPEWYVLYRHIMQDSIQFVGGGGGVGGGKNVARMGVVRAHAPSRAIHES